LHRFVFRLAIVTFACVVAGLLLQHLLARDEVLAMDAVDQITRPVTVADVMAADIRMPTRSKVSLPGWSYRQAFPDATDEPEYVIDSYQQSPTLDDMGTMPKAWRKHFPQALPVVADRLPRNPAVVLGPDGIGKYGGIWHRTTTNAGDTGTKLQAESFVRFDPKGRVQPNLAYKWDIEDGNRVYTFHMRKGHKWSDGQPFTVRDIMFVTNMVIGSPYWSSYPDWMQATDGTNELYARDVDDWPAFARYLLNQSDQPGSAGAMLIAAGGDGLKQALNNVVATGDEPAVTEMIGVFNSMFWERALFDATVLEQLDLTTELQQLQQRGPSTLDDAQRERLWLLIERADLARRFKADATQLDEADMHRLNVLLFRAAFPEHVKIATLEKVTIEAVPDAEGDDSHIIRFTFPKPNSIFLEKTATFMFYRGLFAMPRHVAAPLHPQGSKRLEKIDIWDWNALRQTMADAAIDTPAGRTFARLDPAVQRMLRGDDELTEEQQARFIDALNAVFHDPAYFAPEAWAAVSFNAELDAMEEQGYGTVMKDWEGARRFKELVIREDLLRRFKVDGIQSFDGDDVYQFNQMMFRAAFDGRSVAGEPVVGPNRAASLNRAASNHPNNYTSWVTRLRAAGQYDPDYNPHPPTLTAWRMVSDANDRDVLLVRNPYYYKVDPQGNQLPYIDALEVDLQTDKGVRLLKLRSGVVDFQVRELEFEDFTVLKQNEKAGGYKIRLWAQDYCGETTFQPIQAHQSDAWVELNADPRFRQALSLALNRQQMIDVVYKGMGEPAQAAVPEGSPYYSEKHRNAYIEYDPQRANQLLDEMGLTERTSDGTRILPNGEPLIVTVSTPEGRPIDLVQMACTYWQDIGINAQMKLRSGSSVSRLITLGLLDMRVHKEGGNYFGPLAGGYFAPTHPAESVQWGQWATFIHSGGRSGWEPPERLRYVQLLWDKVVYAESDEEKFAAWHKLAEHTAETLPTIGVTTAPGKVVLVKDHFKNVPKLALAGWIAHDPSNCNPEVFYIDASSGEAR